jgi:hypothetical protein
MTGNLRLPDQHHRRQRCPLHLQLRHRQRRQSNPHHPHRRLRTHRFPPPRHRIRRRNINPLRHKSLPLLGLRTRNLPPRFPHALRNTHTNIPPSPPPRPQRPAHPQPGETLHNKRPLRTRRRLPFSQQARILLRPTRRHSRVRGHRHLFRENRRKIAVCERRRSTKRIHARRRVLYETRVVFLHHEQGLQLGFFALLAHVVGAG